MELWQLVLVSVTQGCVYGLIGLGFVLIYKSSETINFAQGDFAILGAYFVYALTDGSQLPFWGAVLLALGGLFFVGFILDKLVITWLIGYPGFVLVILTIGLGLVLRAFIGFVWGYEPVNNVVPPIEMIEAGWTGITTGHVYLVLATLVLCLLQVLFFKYTKWGVALTAISQNQLAAYYVGIPVRRLLSISWGLGVVCAGVSGIFLSTVSMVDPLSGLIGLKAFAAAVIGGLGSLPGAMLGGFVIAFGEQLAGAYLPAGSQDFMGYLLMLCVLVVRPHGLINQIQLKKV